MKASHSILARSGLVLAALAACAVASAVSIQYPISAYSSTTDWSVTRSVTRFNPTLGTLLSVDFSLTAGMFSDITLANLSDQSTADITGTVTTAYSITGSTGLPTYLSGNLQVSKSDTNFAINPTQSFGNGPWKRSYDHTTNPSLNSSGTFAINSTNATTLLAFTGLTPIDLLIGATGTSVSTSSNGNSRITYATTANTVGYVQYNYIAAPVPEPASIAALGLGAVAMIRRRKAKAVAR